jgi:hypothetical protein
MSQPDRKRATRAHAKAPESGHSIQASDLSHFGAHVQLQAGHLASRLGAGLQQGPQDPKAAMRRFAGSKHRARYTDILCQPQNDWGR